VKTIGWFFLVSRLPALLVLGFLGLGLAAAGATGDSDERPSVSPALDLGTQPLGFPAGVISAVMARDRLLRNALAATNEPLQIHPFRSGAEMVALLDDGRLEAGLLGDMPTLLAACTGQVWIAGLVKQAPTMLIAKGATRVQDLVGKRVGYADESSAHLALLQGLATAGLDVAQVRLVPLPIDAMPAALAAGTIEAFAAWEPAPTIALSHSRENRIVFQAPSTDYFVIGRAFASRSPESAHQLMASLVRALDWLRRSRDHREQAARWALVDATAFAGPLPSLAPPISVAQLVTITLRDILTVPSAPAIQRRPDHPPLKSEFEFLERCGKLPVGATWAGVAAAFDNDWIARVLADPRHYQLATFDYAD
jgi:NitT/TauT family transport system substrate-binding protein